MDLWWASRSAPVVNVIPENSYLFVGSSRARTPRGGFFPSGLFSLATGASFVFQRDFPIRNLEDFGDGLRCGELFDSGRTEPWEFRLMC